ncbi:MAG TPA: hypothetical protein VEK38_02420 [Candidatus Bathyarchaeia archaeon]|nr:hypothetical protein [Candidatus Bathyarchaeia archaeon]
MKMCKKLFFVMGILCIDFCAVMASGRKRKESPPLEEKQVQKKKKTEQIVLQVAESPVEVQVAEPQQVIKPLKVYLAEDKEIDITDPATINLLLNSLVTIKNMTEGSMEVENESEMEIEGKNEIEIYLSDISASTFWHVIQYLRRALVLNTLSMTDLGLLINACNYLDPEDATIFDRLCAVYAKRVKTTDDLKHVMFPPEIVKKITLSISLPAESYVYNYMGNRALENLTNHFQQARPVKHSFEGKPIISMHGGNSQYLFYVVLWTGEVVIYKNATEVITVPIKGVIVHISSDGTLITSAVEDATVPGYVTFFVTDILTQKSYNMGSHKNRRKTEQFMENKNIAGAFRRGQELRFFLVEGGSKNDQLSLLEIDKTTGTYRNVWQKSQASFAGTKSSFSRIFFNHEGTIIALTANVNKPPRTTKMVFINIENEQNVQKIKTINMKYSITTIPVHCTPVLMMFDQLKAHVIAVGYDRLFDKVFDVSTQEKEPESTRIDGTDGIGGLWNIMDIVSLEKNKNSENNFINAIMMQANAICKNIRNKGIFSGGSMSFVELIPWSMSNPYYLSSTTNQFSLPYMCMNQEQGYMFFLGINKDAIHVVKLSHYYSNIAINDFFAKLTVQQALFLRKICDERVHENKKLVLKDGTPEKSMADSIAMIHDVGKYIMRSFME